MRRPHGLDRASPIDRRDKIAPLRPRSARSYTTCAEHDRTAHHESRTGIAVPVLHPISGPPQNQARRRSLLRGTTKEDHYSMRIGSTSVLAVAIACAPLTAALAQNSQTASSQNGNARTSTTPAQTAGSTQARQRQFMPGRLVVPVTGTAGDAAVNGTFAVQRFARTDENGIAAVGTLTLTFTDQTTTTSRTLVTQSAMPLARSLDVALPTEASEQIAASAAAAPATTIPSARACETLRLVLGAIDVAPLGLAVHVDQVTLDITAQPGLGERLGALLCEVTTELTGNAAPAQLVTTLNALLDVVG